MATATATPTPASTPSTPLEDPRIKPLHDRISALETQISETQTKSTAIENELKNPSPQSTVSAHIKLLHTYNEIRDVGQGLMGMMADKRGCTVREVYEELGVGERD